jgi:FkbH-like protein
MPPCVAEGHLPEAVVELLRKVDSQPVPAAYAEAARDLRANGDGLEALKVSLLASFTIDPLVPYLVVEAARSGFAVNVQVGGFNNVIQELINPAGACLKSRPDIVYCARHLEDVSPAFAWEFLTSGEADIEAEIDRIVSDLSASLSAFRQYSTAAVVLHNFSAPLTPGCICDAATRWRHTEAIRRLNQRMAATAASVAEVFVLDYDCLVAEVGARNWQDDKLKYLARAPLSARALRALADRYATCLQSIRRAARKCLVLDLDGTLWGNVVGEVGTEGVAIGRDYPGTAFQDFQRAVRQLKQQGVLLAINSKNNLEDVQDVFRARTEMVLTLDDFAAVRINWQSKPANMLEIADELNIGLDSLVFVDDSAAERDLMRRTLPSVLTLEMPSAPMQFVDAILKSRAFERLTLTTEDRTRMEMYRAQGDRRRLQHSALNVDDFLSSLKMRVTIEPVDLRSFDRVVDLVRKTNQFNLTTRRHSAAHLAAMIADPAYGVFSLSLTDRFGDNGIVGVAIVHTRDGAAHIDTFLLSCRVIGRTVETALLAYLVRWGSERGLRSIEGEFVPTAKNAPASDFFERHHFEPAEAAGAVRRWRLALDRAAVQWPSYMDVTASARAS